MLTYLRQEAGPTNWPPEVAWSEQRKEWMWKWALPSVTGWIALPSCLVWRKKYWVACVPKGSSADHAQLALSGSQVFPFISDKLSAKSQPWGRRGGNEWREGDTPDVFWEDGRKLFLSTNAFRHPLCLQMLNLGTLPGSLFSLKRKFVVCLKHPGPVSPVSGRISFACGWSFGGLRGA